MISQSMFLPRSSSWGDLPDFKKRSGKTTVESIPEIKSQMDLKKKKDFFFYHPRSTPIKHCLIGLSQTKTKIHNNLSVQELNKLVVERWVGRCLPLRLINSLSSSFRIKIKLVPTADKKDLLQLSQLLEKNKDSLHLALASLDHILQKHKRNVWMQCSFQPLSHFVDI